MPCVFHNSLNNLNWPTLLLGVGGHYWPVSSVKKLTTAARRPRLDPSLAVSITSYTKSSTLVPNCKLTTQIGITSNGITRNHSNLRGATMPRKKRASIVDTLLSVKGVARLLRNIKLQDPLGTDTTVASGSNSIEEWSSTDRRSRRTSESPGRKHRHQRGGTRPKSHHPGTWPESPEPRDFEDVFQDDKSEY